MRTKEMLIKHGRALYTRYQLTLRITCYSKPFTTRKSSVNMTSSMLKDNECKRAYDIKVGDAPLVNVGPGVHRRLRTVSDICAEEIAQCTFVN